MNFLFLGSFPFLHRLLHNQVTNRTNVGRTSITSEPHTDMWKVFLFLSLGAFQYTGMAALHYHCHFIIAIACIFNVVSYIAKLRVLFFWRVILVLLESIVHFYQMDHEFGIKISLYCLESVINYFIVEAVTMLY